jgi:hypothetical protein
MQSALKQGPGCLLVPETPLTTPHLDSISLSPHLKTDDLLGSGRTL